MPEMTPEDISAWLNLSVTKEFFERIKLIKEDYDNKVHSCLKNPGTIDQAGFYNAGMDALVEVLNGPKIMIEDLKEKEKDGESQ